MTSTPYLPQWRVLTAQGWGIPAGGPFSSFHASASRRTAALCRVPAVRLLPLTPARVCAAGTNSPAWLTFLLSLIRVSGYEGLTIQRKCASVMRATAPRLAQHGDSRRDGTLYGDWPAIADLYDAPMTRGWRGGE